MSLTSPENPNTNFYLKGAFKKADGSNYFGLTKLSGSWIKNGSGYSSQFSVTTDSSGNWSGNLEVKPDNEDSGFTGTGYYIFRVGKYNSKDANPSVSWSNEITIKIKSVSSSAASPAPSTINTVSLNPSAAAPKPTVKSFKPQSSNTLVYRNASIAGTSASAVTSAAPASSPLVEVKNQKQTNPLVWVGLIFIFAGAGLIGYIYFKKNGKIHF